MNSDQKRNEKRNEVAKQYFNVLSENVPAILQDPLDERTRKRQQYLLISAIVTILLSLTIIDINSAEISGLEIRINKPETILMIAGLITLYYLTIFIIGVIQDLKIHKYRIESPTFDLILQTHKSVTRVLAIGPEQSDLMRQVIRQKHQEETDSLNSTRDAILEKIKNVHSLAELDQARKELEIIAAARRRHQERQMAELHNFHDLMQAELQEEMRITKSIGTAFRELKFLTYLRNSVEIIFPIGLAVYAIWVSRIWDFFG